MEGKKRQFTKEFKKEAVEYSLQSGKTIEQVACDLLAFPGHGKENLMPQEEKVRKLQKKLNDIRIERDILKKTLAIFTKKP